MNLEYPITRTKILVPRRRPELISRQRLLDIIYELLDNRLILIAAPAGYGKTSLLIDFISQSDLPFCWYSLDLLDREPLRFIAHFVSALHVRFPKFGQSSAQALNHSSQDHLNIDALVTTIINDIYENIREHFVIVLDDYHLVRESKPVDHFISRFIQDADENCHVVIASRTLLTLPDLPLMVARSQVGGLSFEELAFNSGEIQELMVRNYHQTLTEQSAEDLARQSEGWITGLLMSTQMMGKEAGSRLRLARVSGVGLYDYLAQQVLEQQPVELQNFLLRSALVEEFNAEFCEQVIGEALNLHGVNWDVLIDDLFRNNLFILPVGEEQVWMRYHHLFRDFLRERMQRDRPDETERIQTRLAEVYVLRSEWDQAYAIYKRQGQVKAIAALAERFGSDLIVRGQLVTLSEWLNSIPIELRTPRAELTSLMATVNVMHGDTRQGLELFDRAIGQLSEQPASEQLAWSLVRRSATQRLLGNYQFAQQDAERALRITQEQPGMEKVRAEALRSVGMALQSQGQLAEALTWFNRSLESYRAINDDDNVAKIYLEIGRVNESLGAYLASEKAYGLALDIWQGSGNTIWQANLLNNLGVLQHLMGDYESAASTLEKAVQLSREGGYPRMEAFSLTSIGDLYRDLEAFSEALDAYRWARLIARQSMDRFLIMYLDLAEAGMARMQGQQYKANEQLNTAIQAANESESPYEQHLCMLESGCLKVSRQEFQMAVPDLEESVRFFSAEGYRGEGVRANLYLAVARDQIGDRTQAVFHLSQMLGLMSMSDNHHPLVTVGREVQPYLEAMSMEAIYAKPLKELVEDVHQFQERLAHIRRNLRRRANAVPFAPAKMLIRALGRMQVRINDHLISSAEWQTQSCRDLFYLIVAHPEGLTKEDIGTIFWPDASPSELKLRFKNNIYRVRHAVGKDAINLQDDYYSFNRQADYEYDVEAFLREIAQAEEIEDPQRKLEHLQTGLKLYKGSYLPEMEETWVLAERERLYQIYADTLLKVAELYRQQHNYDTALNYCQDALKDDPCMEAAHRLAMRIHAEMGSRAALVRQFEECRRALFEEVAADPSPQTQELFDFLMKQN